MKIKVILFMFFLTGIAWAAHAQGIQFQKGSFEQTVQEAGRLDKLIFIDFYTEWCGPCKILAKNVFTREDVGTYFNENFVCCQLDAEKEGRELARKYAVEAYPTLLFIDAEGNVVKKATGAISAEEFIACGQEAVAEKNDPNNMAALEKRYESGNRDEAFLRTYIEKMAANDMNPEVVIEDYLKVQKSMPENSSKMMEFLLEYMDFLSLGGEAERIFQTNKEEYFDIATRLENKKLEKMYMRMMNTTREKAMASRDVAMYELFINRWLKLPTKPYHQDYNDLRLTLLSLKGDQKAYRDLAFTYLDSIVDSRTIADIRERDSVRYADYCKRNPLDNVFAAAMREGYRDVDARLQTQAILKVGGQLLKEAKRKDFKRFSKWIEHGKCLLPNDYRMVNFEADVLYHQGKKVQAIETKRQAIGMIGQNDRNRPRLEDELEKMEKGTF